MKSVIFFSTLWGMTIFSSASSCFHISKETQLNVPEKTMKEISEQSKKDLEDSAKIVSGELTGYEPGISTSARIGGLQAKRLIESGQGMIKKEINEQNVSSGWVKPKDIKKVDTEKNLPKNKQKELSEEVKKAIQRAENDAYELRDLPMIAEVVGSPIYVLDHKTGALVDSVTISFKSKKLLTGSPIYLTYNASNGHICGPNYCGLDDPKSLSF